MNATQLSPKDPRSAAEMLAALEEKDKDERLCRFPLCAELRQTTSKTGRPSAYCHNPEHTALSNHRIRKHLRDVAAGLKVESSPLPPQPLLTGIPPIESLRSSVVNGMLQLQHQLERYVMVLTQLADPDLSAAQIQAALHQAETRIAEVQQAVSIERALRLAAESARQQADVDVATEREAVEQAIERMEDTEAKMGSLRQDFQQQITTLQAEQDEALDRERTIAQQKIAALELQAKAAIAEYQTAASLAQEESRQAQIRAYVAEADARVQTATAERLVSEAQAGLKREQSEVDRLRSELAFARTQVEQVNARAEVDRAEARITLERERSEVDRLRRDLAATHVQAEQATARASHLAQVRDESRSHMGQSPGDDSNQKESDLAV